MEIINGVVDAASHLSLLPFTSCRTW